MIGCVYKNLRKTAFSFYYIHSKSSIHIKVFCVMSSILPISLNALLKFAFHLSKYPHLNNPFLSLIP